jgi:GGDEF domain-containing protein
VRGYDLAARVEPQGFGVLLPGADRAEAEVVAQRIRAGVAAIELAAAEPALLSARRSGDAVVAAPARKTDEPPAGRW